MSNYKVSVFVGSLRKESFNLKMAKEIIRLAPKSLTMELVNIGRLPHYNQDLDGAKLPKEWIAFRDKIKSADGVLFVTPEYNRSIPGVLKNAIDVGSRPYGENSWEGKAGAVISVTPSGLGAFGANHILRQSMVFLDVPMMQQPEAYISNAAELFDKEGKLIVEDTEKFIQNFTTAYADWVAQHA